MTPESAPNPPEIGSWQASSVRFAVFPTESTVSLAPQWFAAITGEDPIEETVLRRLAQHTVSGPFLQNTLRIEAQLDRFQIKLVPRDDSEFPPTLGQATTTWDEFAKAVLPFFSHPTCPAVTRLGFAADSIIRLSDRREGYLYLHGLLPGVRIDPDDMQDLLFQVNRPRTAQSVSFPITLNRLCKWSVLTYTLLASTPLAPGRPRQPTQLRSTTALSAEMDINTSDQYEGSITRGAVRALLSECIDAAKTLLEVGDTP